MHFQYPLEALAQKRLVTRQDEFAQRARQAVRDSDDVRFHLSPRGLRILAADEDVLARVAEVLRDLYGDFVEMHPPRVRLMPGNPVQEPIMSVRVSTRPSHRNAVREELHARGATIAEECARSHVYIVRGEAPLASLLGLPSRLDALTGATALHWIRLNRYAPVPSGPGSGAA